MSNNCCGTDYTQGGTWEDVTLITPDIVDAVMKNTTLNGGVKLDDATAQDIADQICNKLKECIKGHIENGTFDNVTLTKAVLISSTLTNAVFDGTVSLDDATKASFVSELCEEFKPCIIKHIQEADLTKLTASNASLTNVEFAGLIKATVESAKGIAEIVGPYIKEFVKEHVEAVKLEQLRATDVTLTDTALRGDLELSKDASDAIYEAIEAAVASKASEIVGIAIGSLSPSDINAVDARNPIITGGRIIDGAMSGTKATGITLDNAYGTNIIFDTGRLKNFTLSGQVPLDTEAKTHLCQQLRDCILALLDESFSQQDVAAVFSDCDGVPRTPGTRIVSCSELTAALALTEQKIINKMPVSDVITGLFYDEEHHKIILETTLDNDKPQRWEIALDEMGGQVVTDKVTIVGTGTTKDPLRVNLLEATELLPSTEQDTWLPTSVYGGRNALLGVPDAWMDLNGWLFPVYRKSAQE